MSAVPTAPRVVRPGQDRRVTWLMVLAAAGLIFVVDSVTPADICISVLYVTIIMIVLRTGVVRDLVVAGIGCVLLTTLSLLLIPGGAFHHRLALVDFALSVFAIGSTSYLGMRLLMVEAAARRTHEEVAKVSRGISLAELTTSIAHEINQPLAAIVANAAAAKRWLAASPPDLAEARKAVEAVASNGERGGAIINGLKRLVATAPSLKQPFDIWQLASQTIDLMRLDIVQHGASVAIAGQKKLRPLIGDPTLFQQTLINLISNALDAVRDAGPQDRSIVIELSETDDACILEISDSGIGVDNVAFDHLFEPFHSTKRDGMGMGLAICRSIVEAHAGTIAARRNHPKGMVFELKIPNPDAAIGGRR